MNLNTISFDVCWCVCASHSIKTDERSAQHSVLWTNVYAFNCVSVFRLSQKCLADSLHFCVMHYAMQDNPADWCCWRWCHRMKLQPILQHAITSNLCFRSRSLSEDGWCINNNLLFASLFDVESFASNIVNFTKFCRRKIPRSEEKWVWDEAIQLTSSTFVRKLLFLSSVSACLSVCLSLCVQCVSSAFYFSVFIHCNIVFKLLSFGHSRTASSGDSPTRN